MKKKDLKKLALLGLAGGTMMATNAGASETVDVGSWSNLIAKGCGGSGGCHGVVAMGQNQPRQTNASQYQQTASCAATAQQPQQYQQSASCASTAKQPQQTASCAGMSQPQQYQQSASCSSRSQQPQQTASCASRSQQPQQQSASCAGMSQPQQYQQSASCASARDTRRQYPAVVYSSGCASYAQAPQQQPRQSGCASAQAQRAGSNSYYASGCGGKGSPAQGTTQSPSQSGCASRSQTAYNYRPANPQATSTWDPQSSQNYYFQDQPYQGQPAAQPGRGQSANAPTQNSNPSKLTAEATPLATRPQLNESQLINLLNPEGLALYNNLDPAGKALAMKLVNATCKGQNECNGLNACKTDKNTCAGKGAKGSTPGPFKDVNSAVKVASKKMGEKRTNAVEG